MVRQSRPSNKQPSQTTTKNAVKPIRKSEGNKSETLPTVINRYELFVAEYIKDFNATQAYIRSGLPGTRPDVRASQLLAKSKVQELVAIAKAERMAAIKVEANYVLSRLIEIDQMDALDILEDDGSVRPIKEWPKIWRQFISVFEVVEMMSGKGDDRQLVGTLKKIKWPDKTKNLELIGKHINVGEFRELVGHSAPDGGAIQVEAKTTQITSGEPIEAGKQYQMITEGL